MKLELMSWPEVEALEKLDKIAILPLGSLEQHGKHLPLGVDFFIIKALADAVEAEIPHHALMLPPLWLGHSPHHMHFPGTVSMHHSTYADILVQAASSLVEAGFSKIVFMNGHGGNGLPMQMALQELKNKYRDKSDLYVCAFHYWSLAAARMEQIRESAPGGMGHACEMETSVMQYLHKELVREGFIIQDGQQPGLSQIKLDMLQGSPVQIVYDFHEISHTGTFGDPTLAAPEKGKLFFAAAVQEVKKFLLELSQL